MIITFKNNSLEELANDDKKLLKKFGTIKARKITRRLNDLRFANTLEDIRNLPGNYHELKGNRKGQWACELDQPYRMVFAPHESPIPDNQDGQYIWQEIKGVEIIEITNYHKEK